MLPICNIARAAVIRLRAAYCRRFESAHFWKVVIRRSTQLASLPPSRMLPHVRCLHASLQSERQPLTDLRNTHKMEELCQNLFRLQPKYVTYAHRIVQQYESFTTTESLRRFVNYPTTKKNQPFPNLTLSISTLLALWGYLNKELTAFIRCNKALKKQRRYLRDQQRTGEGNSPLQLTNRGQSSRAKRLRDVVDIVPRAAFTLLDTGLTIYLFIVKPLLRKRARGKIDYRAANERALYPGCNARCNRSRRNDLRRRIWTAR